MQVTLMHGSNPPPPSPILGGGPKNLRPKKLGGGGLEQKIKFGEGRAKFNGGPKVLGGPMNPIDVMVVVLKDILLC